MLHITRKRILAGPFEGLLSDQAILDLFEPYGEVLQGGRSLGSVNSEYTSGTGTFGFVDFKNEGGAEKVILAVQNGSFGVHGAKLWVVQVEEVREIPKDIFEWAAVLVDGLRVARFPNQPEKESSSKESGSEILADSNNTEGVEDEEGPVTKIAKSVPVVGTSKGQNVNAPDKNQPERTAKETGKGKGKGKGKEKPR